MDWQIIWLDATGSTNDELHGLALQGAPAGTVIVADSQSSGRGRRGNTWVAPPGKCLLCSILLRPEFPMDCWPRLTHAASLAMAQTLESLGLTAQIKWPNDVYIAGRKICGILLETFTSAAGGFVVLGFGLNVNVSAEEWPQNLATPATSVSHETGKQEHRESILDNFLQHFEKLWPGVHHDFPSILEAVETRSFLTGHRVTLEIQGRAESGTACGLTPNGGLLFEDRQGVRREIFTADTIRRVDG